MDGHRRPLSSGCGLCLPSPSTHPFVLACSSLSRPLPAGAQIPQAPVPFLYSCLPHAGAPFSLTHLPRLGSHPLSLWGQLLRHLHSTGHPDTVTLTQPLAQSVCCVCRSLSHNRPRATEIKGLCPIYPQPIQCPTQELPFEIPYFPSAKILIPDFLPSDHPPFLFPTCTRRM